MAEIKKNIDIRGRTASLGHHVSTFEKVNQFGIMIVPNLLGLERARDDPGKKTAVDTGQKSLQIRKSSQL
jgi:hypothetical protein